MKTRQHAFAGRGSLSLLGTTSKARVLLPAISRVWLAVAALFLAASGASEPGSEAEVIAPDVELERSIAGGERHVFRVDVPNNGWLVELGQQGINLVLTAQGSTWRAASDVGLLRWGLEVMVLEAAGEHHIEVRPRDPAAGGGRYTLKLLELPERPEPQEALRRLSQAGEAAFEHSPAGRLRAITTYRQVAELWRSLGERRWEAEALSSLGAVEAEDRALRPAIESFSRAAALWHELAEPRREAASWNEIGLSRNYAGEATAARQAFERAIALWQQEDEPIDAALTHGNLCYLDHRGGELSAALACYEEVRARFHELGDGSQEARLLNLLGGVYDLMGEPDAALSHYHQALDRFRQAADPRSQAQVLNNLAVVQRRLGDWQEALRLYGQVKVLLAAVGDRLQEGALLSNLGFTYANLGEPERGLTLLTSALELRRETGDQGGEVITLNQLGETWRLLGDPEQALTHFRRAMGLAVSLGDRRHEALTRLRLGELLLEQGQPTACLGELTPALATFEKMGLSQREAQGRELAGRALAASGQATEALPALLDVLARRRHQRDRAGEATALQALAQVERRLGHLEAAVAYADEALARVEELRRGFVSPDLKSAFVATQRRAYTLRMDLWMDRHAAEPAAGHDRQALALSERARARSLLDGLEARAGLARGGVPAEALERRAALRRRLSAKADQQLKEGGARAEALGLEVETLRTDLDSLEAELRHLDPRYAAAAAPQEINTEAIAALLDPATLLLEYSLGPEASYLWAVAPGFFRSFVLPPERDIEALVRSFHGELSSLEAGARNSDRHAEALSRLLLGPAWSEASRARRLVVVPDGALHLLPFGALPTPGSGEPLVADFEITYLPSATTLALGRQHLAERRSAPRRVAVLADPVFSASDPRLSLPSVRAASIAAANPLQARGLKETGSRFERLPSSRREAEAIVALARPGEVWTALDFAASREVVVSGGLKDFAVLHLATHGLADLRFPELSGLVLSQVDAAGESQDGVLTLADIYDLELKAELVVLSGCRTALGKEVRGEGLMGLTRGFLHAGVPRVVASLWQVQDSATAELMTRFYRGLWQEGLPAAAALRAAQRSLAREPRYRHPYYWAGFVLQGDWR